MNTQTEVKHTPGPWRIGDAGRTVFGPPNGNPAPEIIATIYGGTSDQAAVTRALKMKSNARLIAAAPELLDAAKGLVWAWNHPLGTKGTDAYAAALENAIAKAEGRI
jgi:hypothetical protein